MKKADIHKAGGILLKDRKLLVVREKDDDIFFAPGGRVELDELVTDSVIRELKEELQIEVSSGQLEEFGVFYAQAAGQDDKTIQMDVFIVNNWQGDPTPDNEVEEVRWITSDNSDGIKLGSIFEHDVIPGLKAKNLID